MEQILLGQLRVYSLMKEQELDMQKEEQNHQMEVGRLELEEHMERLLEQLQEQVQGLVQGWVSSVLLD